MTYDYTQAIIPVFPYINDIAEAPTERQGGNGGFYTQQLNRIAQNLNTDFEQLNKTTNNLDSSINTLTSNLESLDIVTDQLQSDVQAIADNLDVDPEDLSAQGITFITTQVDIHVSPTGDDVGGDGSPDAPYATPRKALRDVADKAIGQGGSIHIKIAPGYYSDGDLVWIPNFLDTGQFYSPANAGDQGYEVPSVGALFIEGTGANPSETRLNCEFEGYHTSGRIVFQNLSFGRDSNETGNISWRWGIYLEQHSGWIYLRNLRVLSLGDNLIYAANCQILGEGAIAMASGETVNGTIFYLNDSTFVNRALTITLESGSSCSGYWNCYASTIEAWFYGDIDYENKTGTPTKGDYFALNSFYNTYQDLPSFAYSGAESSGDEFMTDGSPFLGYYQNYWAIYELNMAVTDRVGELPPGYDEVREQDFQIDCAFSGTFRTNGPIAFFNTDKTKAVGQQTITNTPVFANAGGENIAGGTDTLDLGDLNSKLNALEGKVNKIINALQAYGLLATS